MVDTVAVLQANYNICVDLATAFRDDKQFMDKIAMVHFSTVSSRNAFKRLRGYEKCTSVIASAPVVFATISEFRDASLEVDRIPSEERSSVNI